MNKEVERIVTFQGPYCFFKNGDFPAIFSIPVENQKGVYIWTISVGDKELVHYIGITGRTFGERMEEHIKGYLSGTDKYAIFDPENLKKGRLVRVWDGLWRGAEAEIFIKRYAILFPKILKLLKSFRIYVAPLEYDARLLERIEAALAGHLYAQEGSIGKILEPGIRYKKRKENENPVLVEVKYNNRIIGLPPKLEV